MSAPRKSNLRLLRLLLTTSALVAVVWVLVDAVREAGDLPLPRASWLVVSAVLLAGGLVLAALAWARLLDGPSVRLLLPGFTLAQLAKYVPGSIWQGVSQVLDAERLAVRRGRASVAFLVQLWTQVLASALVGSLLIIDGVRWWLLALAAGALIGPVTLMRPVLRKVISLAGRALRQEVTGEEHLPPSRAVLLAVGLGVGTTVLGGWSYASLIAGPAPDRELVVIVAAFAAAWALGFLIVPLPAGAGVREFALLAALGDRYGAAAVLSAAVIHRLVAVVTELLLAVGARIGDRVGAADGSSAAEEAP